MDTVAGFLQDPRGAIPSEGGRGRSKNFLSKPDTTGTEESVLNSEVSLFKRLLSVQMEYLGPEYCPVYGGVLESRCPNREVPQ